MGPADVEFLTRADDITGFLPIGVSLLFSQITHDLAIEEDRRVLFTAGEAAFISLIISGPNGDREVAGVAGHPRIPHGIIQRGIIGQSRAVVVGSPGLAGLIEAADIGRSGRAASEDALEHISDHVCRAGLHSLAVGGRIRMVHAVSRRDFIDVLRFVISAAIAEGTVSRSKLKRRNVAADADG